MQAFGAKFTMHLGRDRVSSGVRLAPHISLPPSMIQPGPRHGRGTLKASHCHQAFGRRARRRERERQETIPGQTSVKQELEPSSSARPGVRPPLLTPSILCKSQPSDDGPTPQPNDGASSRASSPTTFRHGPSVSIAILTQ